MIFKKINMHNHSVKIKKLLRFSKRIKTSILRTYIIPMYKNNLFMVII